MIHFNNEIQDLLDKMKKVVDEVMLCFQTDFTEHDTDYITGTQAQEPFIWAVRERGTHIFSPSDPNALSRLRNFFDHYDNKGSCLFYVFTGQKFIPVFHCKVMEWGEKLLSNK